MIVLSDLLVDLFGLLRIYLLDKLGGYTGIDTARLHDRLAQYDRSGRYDSTLTNHGMIQHHRAHADQCAVTNLRTMDRYVVTDGYVIANLDG